MFSKIKKNEITKNCFFKSFLFFRFFWKIIFLFKLNLNLNSIFFNSLIFHFINFQFFQTIYSILPRCYPIMFSVIFGICHQTMLKSTGLQTWILDENANKRDNLMTANAEGLVSLLGYVTIFYGSLAIGEFMAKTRLENTELLNFKKSEFKEMVFSDSKKILKNHKKIYPVQFQKLVRKNLRNFWKMVFFIFQKNCSNWSSDFF